MFDPLFHLRRVVHLVFMIRQMEVGGGAGKEFPGTSHGACGVVVTSQNGIMVAFKLLLCGVNNSYDVQVKEVKDAPSSDESSKKMHVQFCKFDNIQYVLFKVKRHY